MSSILPSLNSLKAFEALSRHLNYQEAAGELHVTPAAVKQLVKKLEDFLQISLVVRKGRHIGLTEAGKAGLVDLHAAFGLLTSATTKMKNVDQRKSLTISAEPSFALAWLVKRIDLFKRTHPEIDVLIDTSIRIIDLDREPVDIAIRYAAPANKTLLYHRLFDDETLAVCSTSLAEELNSLEDLEKAPLIHFDEQGYEWLGVAYRDMFAWQPWLEIVGAGHVKPNKGLRFNDYNIAIQAAIAGQGVVLGSWPVVRDAIDAGVLVAPFSERVQTGFGYDLAVPVSTVNSPEIMAFVDWITAEAAASR